MIEDLARAIHLGRAVLFVSAGVSMGLGLPSWGDLTAKMANDLGYEPDILIGPGANYLTIAEFYKLEKGKIGALRSWMDREWNVKDDKILGSRVHNQSADLGFRFIYTTNFDSNLERMFDLRKINYAKIANAKDISLADPDLPHIVKFHGDFEDDNSIFLTE
jgi:SIR2-like domain